MKKLQFILISTILFCSCGSSKNDTSDPNKPDGSDKTDQPSDNTVYSDFDFTPYYEPHITAIHKSNDTSKHFYSAMMIVEIGQKVYISKDNSRGSIYDITFSFDGIGDLLDPVETFPLDSAYELHLYEFPIGDISNMIVYEESEFRAVVYDPPAGHPHDHPQKVHDGTVHKPGIGGEGTIDEND
ncbi:hypothetical protein [Ekhidna sp.]|uniref:hypothetical protein n=1 Tax=Ekhidna sp. TaxID=2608089 RepID=UPI003CCBF377